MAPTGRSAVKESHNPATAPDKPRIHPTSKRAVNDFATNDALNAGMIRNANTSNTPATLTARVMTTANEAKKRNSHRKPGGRAVCPAVHLGHRSDGALSGDGQILGTYLHGLFESPPACTALLAWSGLDDAQTIDYHAQREASIERLADAVAAHLDTARLRSIFKHTAVPA